MSISLGDTYTLKCEVCGSLHHVEARERLLLLPNGTIARGWIGWLNLPEFGVTEKQAYTEARWGECESKICACCGGIYRLERRVARPQGTPRTARVPTRWWEAVLWGCAAQVAGLVIAWSPGGFFDGHRPTGLLISFLGFMMMFVRPAVLISRRDRLEWARALRRARMQPSPFRQHRCCGASGEDTRFRLREAVGEKRFPCRACGARAVKVTRGWEPPPRKISGWDPMPLKHEGGRDGVGL